MNKNIITFTILFSLSGISTAQCAQMNVSTFAPAPFGNFQNISSDQATLNSLILTPTIVSMGEPCSIPGEIILLETNPGPPPMYDLQFCQGDGTVSTSPGGNWTRDSVNGYLYLKTLTDFVGIGTDTPASALNVTDGAVLFNGTIGSTPASGAGTRLMWIPAKAAFRAGQVTGIGWDDIKIGSRSAVLGGNNNGAQGVSSATLGGDNNVAIGANSIIAGGTTNLNSGQYSAMLGGDSNQILSGDNNSILGGESQTISSGNASTIIGGAGNQITGSSSSVINSFISSITGNFSVNLNARNANIAGDNIVVIGGVTSEVINQNNSIILRDNVGINDSTPEGTLTVNGNILTNVTTLGQKSVVTSDTNSAGFGINSSYVTCNTTTTLYASNAFIGCESPGAGYPANTVKIRYKAGTDGKAFIFTQGYRGTGFMTIDIYFEGSSFFVIQCFDSTGVNTPCGPKFSARIDTF